jgi:hypothetical protein
VVRGIGLKGFVHSLTHPVELRYNDLLQQIEANSRTIDELASSEQQAELRHMQDNLNTMLVLIERTATTVSCELIILDELEVIS